MKYQLENFSKTFGPICEFVYINAPYQCTWEDSIKFFEIRGVRAPYRAWMYWENLPNWLYSKEDMQATFDKVEPNFQGTISQSVKYLVDYLNGNQPFDGIVGFSQGFLICQVLYKCARYFPKQIGLKFELPNFLIDFSCPPHVATTFFYLDKFVAAEKFIPGVESIHIRNQGDVGHIFYPSQLNFENAPLIKLPGSHRPPRALDRNDLKRLRDFIAKKYEEKYKVEPCSIDLDSSPLSMRPRL